MRTFLSMFWIIIPSIVFCQFFEGKITYEIKFNLSIKLDSLEKRHIEIDTLNFYFIDNLILTKDTKERLVSHIDIINKKIFNYEENKVYVSNCKDYNTGYLDSISLSMCPFINQVIYDTVIDSDTLTKVISEYGCGRDIIIFDQAIPAYNFDFDFIFAECSNFVNETVDENQNNIPYFYRRTFLLNRKIEVEIKKLNIEIRKLEPSEYTIPKTKGRPKQLTKYVEESKVKKSH